MDGFDLQFKMPLLDNVANVLSLPNVGARVRLVCPLRYHADIPAYKLGEPSVQQSWIVPPDFQQPDPMIPRHGNFDLASYTQELFPDGSGVELSFVMPAELTSIEVSVYARHYDTAFMRVIDRRRSYTLILRPRPDWEEAVAMIPLPLP